MDSIHLVRELNLKDLEIFKLKNGMYGNVISYMVIADFKRTSNLDDFPYLNGIEDEDHFSRNNFIKVFFVSDKKIEDDYLDIFTNIASGFLDNKNSCHWNCLFDVVDSIDFSNIIDSRSYMLSYFEKYLNNFNFFASLSDINDLKFDYLSQI